MKWCTIFYLSQLITGIEHSYQEFPVLPQSKSYFDLFRRARPVIVQRESLGWQCVKYQYIRLYCLPVLFVLRFPTSWSSRSASWWEVFNKYKSAPVGRSTSLRLAWLTHLRSGIVVNLLVCNVVSSVVSSLFCFCLIPPCLAWAWEHESKDKEEWGLQLRPVTKLRIIFHG